MLGGNSGLRLGAEEMAVCAQHWRWDLSEECEVRVHQKKKFRAGSQASEK